MIYYVVCFYGNIYNIWRDNMPSQYTFKTFNRATK